MDQQMCLKMIMGYLKTKGYVQSFLHLQKQSNIQYQPHSKEIQFFKKVVTEGDFKEALNFLEPFQSKLNQKDYKLVNMNINRQRLFELVQNPDEIELRELLERDIPQWCNQQEYQELFQCLTLKSMKELPGFEKWSVHKGRLECFQTIKPYIQLVESQTIRRQNNSIKLQDVFQDYFNKSSRSYRNAEITLNPFQQQILKEESKAINQRNHNNNVQEKKREQYDKKYLYPKVEECEEPSYSNNFPSRPISEHENYTFSQGKKAQNNYKIKLLSTVLDERAIRVCQFSQDGKLFAIGTNSSSLKIFNVEDIFETCRPKSQLDLVYQISNHHSKSIFSLDWTYNKKLMVTCSNDANVKLIKFNNNFKSHETVLLGKHEGCIRMVRFDQLGTKAVSCAEDGIIKTFDVQKAKQLTAMRGHTSNINAIKVQNSHIYSVSKDCTLRMWDLRTGAIETVSKPAQSQMTYIARGTEGHVVSHKNGYVSFYNSSLQPTNIIKVHEDEVRSVEGLLDENLLITSSFDGNVCILKIIQDKITQQYHRHNSIKQQDKVVHAVFNRNLGFASSSNLGVCNIFAMI